MSPTFCLRFLPFFFSLCCDLKSGNWSFFALICFPFSNLQNWVLRWMNFCPNEDAFFIIIFFFSSLTHFCFGQNPTKQRKIICMGFPGVGKTAIGVQFVEKEFMDSYNPTISNTFHTLIQHKGSSYDLEIVDSAGQDEHSVWHEQQAIGVDGFILVYSVVNRKSFDVAKVINEKILDACGTEKIARVLVGNKSDMRSKREVSTEEGLYERMSSCISNLLFERSRACHLDELCIY